MSTNLDASHPIKPVVVTGTGFNVFDSVTSKCAAGRAPAAAALRRTVFASSVAFLNKSVH